MKRIRKGNDIRLTATVYQDGKPATLSADTLAVSLHSPLGSKLVEVSVAGSTFSFTFAGKDQDVCGKYCVLIQITSGSTLLTADADAFKLVDNSAMTGGEDDALQTESVVLSFDV